MKWIVLAMLLVGGVAYAEPPPAFVGEPGMLVTAGAVVAEDGSEIVLYVWLVPTPTGNLGQVFKLDDGTVVMFDPEPDNPTSPVYIDRGFCPVDKKFPTNSKPTNDFIDMKKCPKLSPM